MLDVAIIGAGPAGLTAAQWLARNSPGSRVAVFDLGRPTQKRHCPVDSGRQCRGCGGVCNVIAGFGGSIHFGDAVKLSKFPSGRRLMDALGEERALALTERVLDDFLFNARPPEFSCPPTTHGAFTLKSYPVAVVTSNEVKTILTRAYESLASSSSVHIALGQRVTRVVPASPGFSLEMADGLRYSARRVLVGVGRRGQRWWKSEVRRLGLAFSEPTPSIGMRFEMESEMLAGVANVHLDYKTTVFCNDIKMKTFCVCAGQYGGQLKFTDYGDVTLLDGHVGAVDKPSPTANFALLAQLPEAARSGDAQRYVQDHIIRPYAQLREDRPGKPVVQWYPDFKCNESSFRDLSSLEGELGFQLGLRDYGVGKLSSLMGDELREAFCTVFERLLTQFAAAPGSTKACDLSKVAVIGLELEGMWDELIVDDGMQTSEPGIYAIGDCSGLAQGILQAAVSGCRAAEHAAERL